MRIGFDAKRAFHNGTGLGHYSRTLIKSLADIYPDHQYYLFNPKQSTSFALPWDGIERENIHEIRPGNLLSKTFSAAWRSAWVKKDLRKLSLDLYHGLSHELPRGIHKSGIRTVVTIHDLIFERYPHQYNPIDVKIYRNKFRYAAEKADRVIAISEQTKRDLVEFYKIPARKIRVCYQSCDPRFFQPQDVVAKASVKQLYQLPDGFFLYVGSVIEREDLGRIVEALASIQSHTDLPLVVIGSGGKYEKEVRHKVEKLGLKSRVLFLSETAAAKNSPAYQNAQDFPAIYQLATAMIYPSLFEGFGIPVLEALASELPVITSNLSSLPEAAGPGSLLIDPLSVEDIAAAMKTVLSDPNKVQSMKAAGKKFAAAFTPEATARKVMDLYESI